MNSEGRQPVASQYVARRQNRLYKAERNVRRCQRGIMYVRRGSLSSSRRCGEREGVGGSTSEIAHLRREGVR